LRHRMGRTWIVLAFVFVAALGLSVAANADILKDGIGYSNLNFAKVIVTYSWSGHYPGQGEVCLKPETITIPPDGSVHINPPGGGFVPTDFVVISRILRGVDQGGYTIYDPPSVTQAVRIDLPCAEAGQKVWGFSYFGARDFGPIFANTPLAMSGLDAEGLPMVKAAELDAAGAPVVNTTAEGHCFVATPVATVTDTKARTVLPEFAVKAGGRICEQLLLKAADRPVPVDREPAKQPQQ